MPTPGEVLASLLESLAPKRAKAEIIPADEEAEELLRFAQKDVRFAPVIARAHESPRKVKVYGGKNAQWMNDTTLAGLHLGAVETPEKLEQYRSELYRRGLPRQMGSTEFAEVYVTPDLGPQDEELASEYHTPNMRDPDMMRRKAATLTHELGHFLNPSGGEVTPDIIAHNPADFQNHFNTYPKIFNKDEQWTDRWYKQTKEKEVREALGDRSRAFVGPPRPEPEYPWRTSLADAVPNRPVSGASAALLKAFNDSKKKTRRK